MPENVELSYPFASFKKTGVVKGDKITFYIEYKRPKLNIAPKDYKDFKKFIEKASEEMKKSIVFEESRP